MVITFGTRFTVFTSRNITMIGFYTQALKKRLPLNDLLLFWLSASSFTGLLMLLMRYSG